MEYRIKNKDGELRWMVCHGRAAKDAEGKPVGWFCSITDVEELVQTRHEALLIQERIKAVLEGSRKLLLLVASPTLVTDALTWDPTGTFLLSIDTEMRITFFEGSLDAPTSISPKAQEALLGKDLSDFLHDSELLEAARKIIDEEETEIGMLREIIGPDGTISWARFRVSSVNYESFCQPLTSCLFLTACTARWRSLNPRNSSRCESCSRCHHCRRRRYGSDHYRERATEDAV